MYFRFLVIFTLKTSNSLFFAHNFPFFYQIVFILFLYTDIKKGGLIDKYPMGIVISHNFP